MSFIDELFLRTKLERARLLATPPIGDEPTGHVTREHYLSFLMQARCYVSHAIPVPLAVSARLPPRHHAVRAAVLAYGDELAARADLLRDNIAALDGDSGGACSCPPSPETTALISYTQEIGACGNGLGFLGLMYVAEGTIASLFAIAADRIQMALRLPGSACTYLIRNQQAFDPRRVRRLEALLNGITRADDRAVVTRSTKIAFELNAGVLQWASRHGSDTAHAVSRAVLSPDLRQAHSNPF